jgi:DNA polymerase (family 10)
MNNQQLADIFERIANLLEINGEVVYKTLAYRRAAESLRAYPREASELYREGKLTEIPGVGKAIAEKIEELLTTGKLGFLERLEQEVPPTLLELLEIPDVGPKKVALFWKQAGITSLMDLESAARHGHLRRLPGIGERSEQRILAGIEALRRRSKRMLLGTVRPIGLRWLNWLRELPGIQQVELAGSLRRWKPTIGDLDLAAAAEDPAAIMDAFVRHPDVVRVLAHGENKSSIELSNGLNVQLWIQPQEKFGSLLQFVTGSKEHNVRLRELAQRKGLSLSEHGITNADGKEQFFENEIELYRALGLDWIPPELREDRGEIQAALEHRLPDLITLQDLQAELHSHSTWSDGAMSIREMAHAAKARGLKMLAVTDHTHSLGIANGLDAPRLRQQRKEIDAVQAELGDELILLQGAEVEIKADGTLDLPDEVLAELDIVTASLHVSLRQPREEITQRLLRAIRNPHVDVIGHPSGRLLPNREGADLDWEAILAAAREENVALEINANPSRLDLDEVHARRAAELGILLSINTDAHSPADLELAEYGVSVARRAWLNAAQVLNTRSPVEIRRWLAEHRRAS